MRILPNSTIVSPVEPNYPVRPVPIHRPSPLTLPVLISQKDSPRKRSQIATLRWETHPFAERRKSSFTELKTFSLIPPRIHQAAHNNSQKASSLRSAPLNSAGEQVQDINFPRGELQRVVVWHCFSGYLHFTFLSLTTSEPTSHFQVGMLVLEDARSQFLLRVSRDSAEMVRV